MDLTQNQVFLELDSSACLKCRRRKCRNEEDCKNWKYHQSCSFCHCSNEFPPLKLDEKNCCTWCHRKVCTKDKLKRFDFKCDRWDYQKGYENKLNLACTRCHCQKQYQYNKDKIIAIKIEEQRKELQRLEEERKRKLEEQRKELERIRKEKEKKYQLKKTSSETFIRYFGSNVYKKLIPIVTIYRLNKDSVKICPYCQLNCFQDNIRHHNKEVEKEYEYYTRGFQICSRFLMDLFHTQEEKKRENKYYVSIKDYFYRCDNLQQFLYVKWFKTGKTKSPDNLFDIFDKVKAINDFMKISELTAIVLQYHGILGRFFNDDFKEFPK